MVEDREYKILTSKERLAKLKALKYARGKSVTDNRQEVYREAEQKKNVSQGPTDPSKLKEKMPQALHKAELEAKGIDFDKLQNLNYSAEEDALWYGKLNQKKVAEKDTEYQNYKQLAQKTYAKNLSKIEKVTTEEYEDMKVIYNELIKQGLSETEIRQKLTNKRKLAEYARQVKDKDEKSYKRRKETDIDNDGSGSGFINDKNKQFNDKLSRHYDVYLKDLKDDIERQTSAQKHL